MAQVDTALGLSESSPTRCSADHSSSATCEAGLQLGRPGWYGGAAAHKVTPRVPLLLSLPASTFVPPPSLIASALSLVAILKCQVQPEITAASEEHSEFSAGSPLHFSKWGGRVPISLIPKTLFSVHNVYFENWQLKIQTF